MPNHNTSQDLDSSHKKNKYPDKIKKPLISERLETIALLFGNLEWEPQNRNASNQTGV